jgi:hypothetical protein
MLLVAMILMTIWPFDLSPIDPLETDAGRIEAYSVIAVAFLLGFPHRIWFASAWPIMLALSDELLPPVVLGHHFNLTDAMWKFFGIGMGIAVGLLVIRSGREKIRTPH